MNMCVAFRPADPRPVQDTNGEKPDKPVVIAHPGDDTAAPPGRLRRPRLLGRAARHLAREAPRGSLTRRLLKGPPTGRGTRLGRLLALEADAEAQRREGAPAYSARRHVELLAAILQEMPTAGAR